MNLWLAVPAVAGGASPHTLSFLPFTTTPHEQRALNKLIWKNVTQMMYFQWQA